MLCASSSGKSHGMGTGCPDTFSFTNSKVEVRVLRRLALSAIVALAALGFANLGALGYANHYYAAAVEPG